MKPLRIIIRNIRDAFKSVFRNFSLSMASISCITITLIVVAISIILSYNVNNFATEVEKDVTIVTFLNSEITEEGRQNIQTEIDKISNIESVTFESKTEVATQMMESSETFKNIMSNWDEIDNPLQDTFLVKVEDINLIGTTADEINKIEGVELVKYGEGMVEQLVTVFDIIKNVSIGIVIALIIVTAFLIANTIKITIVSRRKEIEIMRLVGASNLNIKIPFIIEGLFLGILGSIIPILATIYGYVTLYEYFDGVMFTQLIQLLDPFPFVMEISLVLLLIGILVGMFGSLRAVKKYLKI